MKVMCIGQSAYDITLPLDHYPIENKKTRVKSMVECGGGSASNCAYLLAKWGMETYFAGVVGNDLYGGNIKKEYASVNINTKYLQTKEDVKTTSSYIISNTTTGTRTILTCKDEKMVMDYIDIDEEFDIILFDGYEEEISKNLIEKNPKAIKILDAGSLKEATITLAHLVDYIVCSHDFAEEYTKIKIDYNNQKSLIDVYETLKKDFTGHIVITLEDNGSFTYDNGYKLISSIKVNPKDSTGAGDIFHGAFTYCIAMNYDLVKTLKISNIAGALSTEIIGGRYSILPKEQIMDKYNELIS